MSQPQGPASGPASDKVVSLLATTFEQVVTAQARAELLVQNYVNAQPLRSIAWCARCWSPQTAEQGEQRAPAVKRSGQYNSSQHSRTSIQMQPHQLCRNPPPRPHASRQREEAADGITAVRTRVSDMRPDPARGQVTSRCVEAASEIVRRRGVILRAGRTCLLARRSRVVSQDGGT